MSLDPSCDATATAELPNCQGCGWTDVIGDKPIPGYTICTGVWWSASGAPFNGTSPRFVIRLCVRCAVRLALQVLEREVG